MDDHIEGGYICCISPVRLLRKHFKLFRVPNQQAEIVNEQEKASNEEQDTAAADRNGDQESVQVHGGETAGPGSAHERGKSQASCM